jgi:hypothetical protein
MRTEAAVSWDRAQAARPPRRDTSVLSRAATASPAVFRLHAGAGNRAVTALVMMMQMTTLRSSGLEAATLRRAQVQRRVITATRTPAATSSTCRWPSGDGSSGTTFARRSSVSGHACREGDAIVKALMELPRGQRHRVFEDQPATYEFRLTDRGFRDFHSAVMTLFTPQQRPERRSLIHCDRLVSLVHLRVIARQLGRAEFNRRAQQMISALRNPMDPSVLVRVFRPSAGPADWPGSD